MRSHSATFIKKLFYHLKLYYEQIAGVYLMEKMIATKIPTGVIVSQIFKKCGFQKNLVTD